MLLRTTAAAVVLLALHGHAFAVSEAVKVACKPDYIAYCDKMVVGSPELRACMKANALKLSKPCLQALVDNKEVTQADVDEYLATTKKAN
jgi:adenylate kinase